MRELNDVETCAWEEDIAAGSALLGKARSTALAAAAESLEHDLRLLGCSNIEDALAPGVPQTVAALTAAGIKLWVLTGDKVETAVSVGRSARLIHPGMQIIRMQHASRRAARRQIRVWLRACNVNSKTGFVGKLIRVLGGGEVAGA